MYLVANKIYHKIRRKQYQYYQYFQEMTNMLQIIAKGKHVSFFEVL